MYPILRRPPPKKETKGCKQAVQKADFAVKYLKADISYGHREPLDCLPASVIMEERGKRPRIVFHPECSATSANSMRYASFLLQKMRQEHLKRVIKDDMDQLDAEIQKLKGFSSKTLSD